MSTSIIAALVANTFPNKDALLTSMASSGIVTLADLKAFDCMALLSKPPAARTVTDLLSACTPHDSNVSDTAVWRTALGHVITLALAVCTDVAPQSNAADAFGIGRYKAIEKQCLVTIRTADRLDGKIVKKASDDLDRGTLSAECYKLSAQKGVLAGSVERKSTIGGLEVTIATEDSAPACRNGEVLMQIWRFYKMMLAAGMRKATPTASTPDAASLGDLAVINRKDSTGCIVKERWHLTPNILEQYFTTALRDSSFLTPKELEAGHERIQQLTVDELHTNFNYESALARILRDTTFVTAARVAAPNSSAAGAADSSKTNARLEKEKLDLVAQVRTLKRTSFAQGTPQSPQGTPPKAPKAFDQRPSGVCFDFQNGKCARAQCKFGHACAKCGDAGHGSAACPN